MKDLEKAIKLLEELNYEDFAPHMGIGIQEEGRIFTYAEEVLKAREIDIEELSNTSRELISRTNMLERTYPYPYWSSYWYD